MLTLPRIEQSSSLERILIRTRPLRRFLIRFHRLSLRCPILSPQHHRSGPRSHNSDIR